MTPRECDRHLYAWGMSRPTASTKPDYVLGTHDAEHARLGKQHSLWRELVHDGWKRAGIVAGNRVVDVGSGPGFATMDLAEIVGKNGRVVAVEISGKFVQEVNDQAKARGLNHVSGHIVDLMHEEIPTLDGPFDAAWCRWVCMFVPDVSALVNRIHHSLRDGGVAVFHEYVQYETYGLQPPTEGITSFTQAAMKSFSDRGGETNIAGRVLRELRQHGFEILSVKPIVRSARPAEDLWQWPAGFIRTYVPRLVESGQESEAWGKKVLDELNLAEQDPQSIMLTPTVLEIIARNQRQ